MAGTVEFGVVTNVLPERSLFLHENLATLKGSDGSEWEIQATVPPGSFILQRPDGRRYEILLKVLAVAWIEAVRSD